MKGKIISFYIKIDDFLKDHSELLIIICTILLSLISFIYYYRLGLTTSYNDARAHLNIARRVGDNITPGLAQLGGV
jgi:hypothetical protein